MAEVNDVVAELRDTAAVRARSVADESNRGLMVIAKVSRQDAELLRRAADLLAHQAARLEEVMENLARARLNLDLEVEEHSNTRAALTAAEAEKERLREALASATKAECSNARRMREAIVEARRRLAKGRPLWNGPCHECDGVLDQALRADNDAEAIRARAALSPKKEQTDV
jgi:chromosome segregation ATPase